MTLTVKYFLMKVNILFSLSTDITLHYIQLRITIHTAVYQYSHNYLQLGAGCTGIYD